MRMDLWTAEEDEIVARHYMTAGAKGVQRELPQRSASAIRKRAKQIAFGIEVCHKHPCDARKVGFLGDKLTLIEIPAYWVLGQVGVPLEMPPEFFLT